MLSFYDIILLPQREMAEITQGNLIILTVIQDNNKL